MKILLVNPPLHYMVSANMPEFVEEERGTCPPLGLLYIASYLREHGPKGVDVKVLDTVLEDLSYKQIAERIAKESPDVLGVHTITFTLLDTLEIVRLAKEKNSRVVTVLGGRHCDIYPTETASLPGVDFIIQGEGELSFTRLIANLNNSQELEKIPGIAFQKGDTFVRNAPEVIKDLDSLPFPARDLTKYRNYRSLLAKRSVYTTLITSRGCPYKCKFCDEGSKRFRAVSAPRIVEEIIDCRDRYGIKMFYIFDSTFTVDKKRVLNFCNLLIEQNVGITFEIRSRVNLVDDEILSSLEKAGCVRIQYGIESGSDRILKNIGKMITVDQVKKVIAATRRYRFEILCNFMIGLPGEVEEDIVKTINLSLELPIDHAVFAITTPYPNTALYSEGIEKGMFGDYWKTFSLAPCRGFEPLILEEAFSKKELVNYVFLAYSKFYKRPKYIWSQLKKIRTFGEFFRKARGGIKVFLKT